MFKKLENLRDKSDQEKKNIALSTALIITLIILVVWGFGTWSNLSSDNKKSESASPIDTIKEDFSELFR